MGKLNKEIVPINNRLKRLASFVEDGSKLIDVGCDHALLDIYLVSTKKDVHVIASDNKKGPLEGARENIKKYHLEDKITLKLGNGIEPIEEDIDTIIISGMGGLNMIGILKYQTNLLQNIKTIILSPNSDTEKVRKEIKKLGFFLKDETLVKEKNIIYPILIFQKGKKHYSEKEYLFGPILLKSREPLFLEYIQNQKLQKEKLLELLPKKYWQRRFQLKKELRIIQKYL